jgi:hypothetical protein
VKGERWVLAVAMVLPSVAAFVYLVALSSGGGETQPNPHLRAAYGATKSVQLLIPVIWLAIFNRAALRIQPITSRGIPAGVAFGVAVAVAIFVLYFGWLRASPLFDGLAGRIRSKLGEFDAATPLGFLTFAAFICVVHSLLEEYYWRWFVFGRLRRHVSRWVAMIIAGIAFMAHHVVLLWVYFPNQFWLLVLPFSLGVAFGGIVWAWLYDRTGSLIGPWVSHFLVDAALIAVGYDLVFKAG